LVERGVRGISRALFFSAPNPLHERGTIFADDASANRRLPGYYLLLSPVGHASERHHYIHGQCDVEQSDKYGFRIDFHADPRTKRLWERRSASTSAACDCLCYRLRNNHCNGHADDSGRARAGNNHSKLTADRYAAVLRAWLLPYWKDWSISSIARNDIQLFLNSKASTYSRSSIRSMRLVLQLTLSFAHLNGWISVHPCVKIKTPRITNESRTVRRAEMTLWRAASCYPVVTRR